MRLFCCQAAFGLGAIHFSTLNFLFSRLVCRAQQPAVEAPAIERLPVAGGGGLLASGGTCKHVWS